ncbi:MAG TPA: TIGR02266 family protein, partial [Kofleriaceae bacterium]
MADPNTRQGKRTPVTLKIKFKSETLEQFIERYAVDVSQGGIFIRTKEPLAVGTQMKFEFQLRDASPLIAGEGTVVWTRENDPSRPAIAPGMGVRFDRLADGSQNVLERILAEKAKQAPQRGNEGPTKPPMFTDTPTKVAPAPVQEALGVGSRRAKSDSEQTPLPPPRPFHSDADDFDEKAFEEATKVRSLDELAAQTAGLDEQGDDAPTNTAINMPPDELAQRRAGGRLDSEPVAPPAPAATIDRESAPGLPEPPAHTPSRPPLDSPAVARTKSGEPVPRTKLGVEPAKAAVRASDSVPRAIPTEPSHPVAPKRPSSAPVVILLLVLFAAAGGAVWWFVLREQ